jgi:hypothetical protein
MRRWSLARIIRVKAVREHRRVMREAGHSAECSAAFGEGPRMDRTMAIMRSHKNWLVDRSLDL